MARQTSSLAASPEERGEEQEWWPDWLRLRALLEHNRVPEARACAQELARKWPDVEHIQHYARVLEPPAARVVPGRKGRPLHREYAWIRMHAREYPGCWLAVYEDRLISADPDLKKVVDAARAELGTERAFLFYQPKPGEWR